MTSTTVTLDPAHRLVVTQHNSREWTAALWTGEQRLAVGYAPTMKDAASELVEELARRDMHHLAELVDRADLPAS